MKTIFLAFLLMLIASCGSETEEGFTRVVINGGNNDKAVLDGGIMVGAANIERIPGKSFSALLTDENQTVVLEIPNGSYRFGAIGYTKSGNGSKISNNLRCAGANNGAIYNLNGQTIVLDLVLSQETCTDALFGPLSERDAGHPTNVPQIEFASCTGALPTAAEAGCTGGSSAGGAISLVSSDADGNLSFITSNTFTISTSGTAALPVMAANRMRIPAGNVAGVDGISLPVVITTASKSYFFENLRAGSSVRGAANGEAAVFYDATNDRIEVYLKD